ncbi:MAG: hypothetical protein HZA77_06580 [Candidatus Schekmanbacteria bacterium]|nr:hypothetical protein [Candidatus Schekmanbacteria bacterium]
MNSRKIKTEHAVSFLFLIILLFISSYVSAKTFNVSNTTQFRKALEDAALNGEDDTLILAAGTYRTTDDGQGTFKFVDNEIYSLTIKAKNGLTADDVIMDGDNTNRVFWYKNSMESTLTIQSVTVKNGNSDNSACGGGIYVENSVIIKNLILTGNVADRGYGNSYGGGIYAKGNVTVTNSTISKNDAVGFHYDIFDSAYGGGIYANGNVTVTNSTISENNAIGDDYQSKGYGGGIYAKGNVTVTNSTISENNAYYVDDEDYYGDEVYYSTYGGGIYSKGNVIITNSTISGNNADYDDSYERGGGIYGYGIFINNIFSDNSSDIYFKGDSLVQNNYVDYEKLRHESSYIIIKKNNIQPNEGDLNFTDSDFRLGKGSIAINKGLSPTSQTFKKLIKDKSILKALKIDKDGNKRIIGKAIDLGPYEYNSKKASK